ncbi:hypothetical protein GCM10018953_42750 [Streptosporangium nondiastaticum]
METCPAGEASGGAQALAGALTMSSRMNSASAANTWENRRPPGVVVSRAPWAPGSNGEGSNGYASDLHLC